MAYAALALHDFTNFTEFGICRSLGTRMSCKEIYYFALTSYMFLPTGFCDKDSIMQAQKVRKVCKGTQVALSAIGSRMHLLDPLLLLGVLFARKR